MKIESIKIGSFGTLQNMDVPSLSTGLNVIFGENESGKTTMMEFIRSTLFPNRKKTYPSYSKSDSGTIRLINEDGSITVIERGDGPIHDSITTQTYRSVFAMTPDDLRDSSIISSGDIKKRFLTVPGGKNLPSTIESVKKEMTGLLTEDRRSSNTKIGSRLSDLDILDKNIASLSGPNDEYDSLFMKKTDLEQKLSNLEEEERILNESIRLRSIQTSQKGNVDNLAAIDMEISQLHDSDMVKEGDRERFNILKIDLEKAEKRYSDITVKKEDASIPLEGYDHEKILRNRSKITELYGSLDRMSELIDRKTILESSIIKDGSKKRLEPTESLDNRLSLLTLMYSTLSIFGILMIISGLILDLPILLLGVVLIPIGAFMAYFSAKKKNATYEKDPVDDRNATVESRTQSLKDTNERMLLLEMRLNDVADEIGVPRSSYYVDVMLLSKLLDQSSKYDGILSEWHSSDRDLRDARSELKEFLSAFGGEERFLKLDADRRKKDKLIERKDELQKSISSSGYDPNMDVSSELPDPSTLDAEISRMNFELGSIRTRMEYILNDDEVERLMDKKASISSEIHEMSRRWGILSIASSLVDMACEDLYSTVQPGVIHTADRYIRLMTNNRYGLENDPRDDKISVRSEEGSKSDGQWSSGLGDQIKLSIKLAVARELSSEPLPILLDDILLTFDHKRKKGGCTVLADISNDMQVLLFTCDRETRDLAVEAGGKLICI